MEAVVLHRVGFLAYPCPKQGQDFKPSAAPLYPNMGQVSPPPPPGMRPGPVAEISVLQTPAVTETIIKRRNFMIERKMLNFFFSSIPFFGKKSFLLVDEIKAKILF